MRVLLREPHGFEGLGAVPVGDHAHDPAVRQRHQVGELMLERSTAKFAASGLPGQHEHLIVTEVDDPLGFDAQVRERAEVLAAPYQHLLETPPLPLHARSFCADPRINDLGIEEVNSRKITSCPVLVHPTHDLHVLLRHRPRSIP